MEVGMKLIIGTRGSALALWQARHVASLIERNRPDTQVDLVTIKTTGDKILEAPLARIGEKGLFTKEIEEALLDHRVDLAVHSMKDLPTDLPQGLQLAAVLKREDPRDVFISRDGRGLERLEKGAAVGTSSLRRRAFLLSKFLGLDVVSVRGNVETRLRKIHSENLAGVILASAGITRMGFSDRITQYVESEMMIPAIGQGALGIETRMDDSAVNEAVAFLDHAESRACVDAERAFLHRMGGGCAVPMAAYAVADGDSMTVTAAVIHPDGTPAVRERLSGPVSDPSVGTRLADILIERGAASIAREVLGPDWKPGL